MNKLDLARSLAKRSHRSQARAADEVDGLVYQLLKEVKRPLAPRSQGKKNSAAAASIPKGRT